MSSLSDPIERLVDQFFTASLDLVAICDRDTILRVNDRWADTLGWQPDDIVGHSIAEYIHPDDMGDVVANIGVLLEGGDPVVGHETGFRRPDGSWAHLLWNVIGDPETGLLMATARDVSEERAAARERDHLLEVLSAQAELQELFIKGGITRDWWDGALARIIHLSGTEYGFIGRIETSDETGLPTLRSLAVTDIAWNDATRKAYDQYSAEGLVFTNLDTLFGVTLATGEMVIANDPSTDPRRGGLPPGHPPMYTYMGIPIRDGDDLLGMIGLANRDDGFSPALERALQPLVSTLAQQLGRARADMETREATRQAHRLEDAVSNLERAQGDLRAFVDAAEEVLEADSVATALAVIEAGIAAQVPTARTRLFVVDPEQEGTLVRASATGEPEVAVADCAALQEGRLRVTRPGLELGGCAHAPVTDTATVCAPVATASESFGLLVVGIGEMHELGDTDTRARLEVLAAGVDALAGALAQVALREHLVSEALIDPLTRLANRRGLTQAVERRMASTDLDARPFGLIIADIDDFKDVNDHLGHLGGDAVLESVGAALAAVVRDDDVVARLGGDEFAVLLAAGDDGTLGAAAERVREALGAVRADGFGRLTASVGAVLVGWGADVTWDTAYEAADRALYEAKASGKGVVCTAPMVGVPDQI